MHDEPYTTEIPIHVDVRSRGPHSLVRLADENMLGHVLVHSVTAGTFVIPR